MRRCVRAILGCMDDEHFFWTEEAKCLQKASQAHHKHGQTHCAGHLDCGIFLFCTKPHTIDCRDYHGRKLGCTTSGTVAPDENLLITHLSTGFPGRTHDDIILAHSKVWKIRVIFCSRRVLAFRLIFSPASAFVPACKKPRGLELNNEETSFNDIVKRPRSRPKCSIGMWKGRFPFWKEWDSFWKKIKKEW